MKKDDFIKKEVEMINNDVKKVVRGIILLLVLILLYMITDWKVWLIFAAFPVALFVQFILGLFLLSKKKQKAEQEDDELDF